MEMGCEDMSWGQLPQNRICWWAMH